MSIGFKCPSCGKALRVSSDKAGKKGKCPFCGSILAVPGLSADDSGADLFSLAALSSLKEGERVEEPRPLAAQPPSPPAAGPAPRHRAPAKPAGKGGFGDFAAACFGAFGCGLRNVPSIFVLLLVLGLVSLLLVPLNLFARLVLVRTKAGFGLMMLFSLALELTIVGYLLRFLLDVAAGGIEGARQSTPPPSWSFGEQAVLSLKWIGLLVVYVAPVITLPLLPLGMLALARTGDGRAFNLIWAARAAARRPGRLALLWFMLLLWQVLIVLGMVLVFVVMAAVTAAVVVAASGGAAIALAIALTLLQVLLLGAVGLMFGCMQYRCVGLLGCHSPELLEMLPERPSAAASLGFITAGLAVTVAVFAALIWAGGGSVTRPREGVAKLGHRAMRRTSEREKLAKSNFLAIADGIRRYRDTHDGQLPPSLDKLVEEGLIGRDCLVCAGNEYHTPVYLKVRQDAPGDTVVVCGSVLYRTGTVFAVCLDGKVRTWSLTEAFRQVRAQGAEWRTLTQELDGPPDHDRTFFHARRAAEKVASRLREFRAQHPDWLATSLAQLARETGMSEEDARSVGDPSRLYVFVTEAGRCGDGLHVLLYDPARYARGRRNDVVLALNGRGVVDDMSASDLEALLAKEARERKKRQRSGAQAALALIGRQLHEYATKHGRRLPGSLTELADEIGMGHPYLRSIGDPSRPYVYVRPADGSYRRDDIIVYDPVKYRGDDLLAVTGWGVHSMPEQVLRRRLDEQAQRRSPRPPPPPPLTPSPKPPVPKTQPAPRIRPGPKPRPVPETRPAVRSAEETDTVQWAVPSWRDAKLKEGHPFREVCTALKEVRHAGQEGVAGVCFGPEARAKTDAAYAAFRKALEGQFTKMMGIGGGVTRTDQKQTLDGVEYDRVVAAQGTRILALLASVQGGRCVGYWYFGHRAAFVPFFAGVGKATYKAE